MTDETQDHGTGQSSLSPEQLVRLKDEVNQTITYGPGLNAREVVGLKTLGAEQWVGVRRDYDDWIKKMRVFRSPLLVLVASVGGVLWYWLARREGWVGWAAVAVGIAAFFAAATLFKREGHREGYLDGYESGFEEGINKAYGIDEKEAMDIHERAIEMQIDEGMIKAFDTKRKSPLMGATTNDPALADSSSQKNDGDDHRDY